GSLDDEHGNLRAALESSVADGRSSAGLGLCAALQRFWRIRGHLSEGRGWCMRVLGSTTAEGGTRERAKLVNAAASLAFWQCDYVAARELAQEALTVGRQLNDLACIGRSLNQLGAIDLDQGDLDSARDRYLDSRKIYLQLGDRAALARVLMNL